MATKTSDKVYERSIDAGHGVQTLVFVDGKCVSQRIASLGNGWYTGDGNPEFVGMTAREIGMKANHFRRVTNERAVELELDRYYYSE